jgi:hypothetical protein
MKCPSCGSERTRRGGNAVWAVYLVLLAIAVPGVLYFHLHAGLVAGIMLAVIVIAHLALNQRVCLDCGTQWRSGSR